MTLRKDLFILIFGHGRSGTTVCSTLLNMSSDFNIAYELYNNHLIGEKWEDLREKNIVLSNEFNGNKIAVHYNLPYKNIMECINKGILIVHKNYESLKVVFVKRNSYSTIISQQKRLENKRKVFLSIECLVDRYIESEKTILKLKKSFPDYHVFNFDKAISCELHRKWLFDYIGSEYHHIYSESYVGKKNYIYGSLREKNAMFQNPNNFPDAMKEIEEAFNSRRFWPWAGSNYV